MERSNSESKGNERLIIHVTPDHGWAWIISISCAFINGITFGLLRSYGVLFFELLNNYNLSRETASWPFSLCTTFTHLSGPIAGLLLSHYTMRSIVFFGSFIAAAGISLCFFATSILEITIYIGIIQGFGIGLSFMQTPVILAQYFQKFRATATAIAYAGGTIGSFIFPPIIEYILDEYELKGCFLLIGAIMLNALPFALLLRPATPGNRVNRIIKGVLSKQLSRTESRKERISSSKKESIVNYKTDRNQMHSLIVNHMCSCDLKTDIDSQNLGKNYQKVTMSLIESGNQVEKEINHLTDLRKDFNDCDFECICLQKQKLFEKQSSDDVNDEKASQTESQKSSIFHKNFKIFRSVIINPLYLILCLTHVSFQWAWMTHQMVIIDYAIDRGMSRTQAVVLLSSFAVADLFGRLASGLVADKRLVRKRNIVSICILLIGVLIFMTPEAKTFRILLTMTIGLGFVSGSIIVLFSVLTMEYVGLDRLPIALGTSAFVVGSSTLVRPLVIGYFRDTFGSYDGLFHFVGIIALLAAMLWLSEPFARLWVTRKRKYGFGHKVIIV